MPRQISEAQLREYQELVAFLDLHLTHVVRMPPSIPFHSVAERVVADMGMSKALSGLRLAVQDSMQRFDHCTPEQLASLDALLRARGIVSVSELRRRYSRKYRGVLKRGVIRSEEEYYLVKSILDDRWEALSEEEQVQLGSLLLAFEKRAADAKQ